MMLRRLAIAALSLAFTGCAQESKLGVRTGPDHLAAVTQEQLTYQSGSAEKLHTLHYEIYTTISDDQLTNKLAQVLEAAHSQYEQLAPGIAQDRAPMNCYIFADREQWADFTRRNTGVMSTVYLKIYRGGYTLHDWFVAYNIGELHTVSVTAHEGWHQFAAHNFKGRLPPFLEEGIACLFEDVQFDRDLPRFNPRVNRSRTQALRSALDEHRLLPLEQLATLHAGLMVDRSGEAIESFYAEDWAFARFCREGEGGIHRADFERLLADVAAGRVAEPSFRSTTALWRPDDAIPLLERYFGLSMEELSKRFEAYIHVIAYDQFRDQFAS